MRTRMRTSLLLAAVLALATLFAVPTQASAAGSSQVFVLHGVPGLNVDVYANEKKILSDFKPGSLAGPLTLPEGSYDLAVFKAGDDPSGTPAIKADGVTVPAGANITVVAHLDADGTPVLTPFVNDVSKVAPGQARLTVRHTAAAPAVDIRANGKVAFKALTNPNEVKADLAAGKITADVTLAGTSTVAIGPADLDLAEGSNTIVYAWGSATDKNLKLAVQVIKGLHSAPGGVPSGSGGLLSDGIPMPLAALALIGFLALAAGTGGLVTASRRSRAHSRQGM
jgi:Domain of unknown function (DUF4397)